MIKYQRLTLLDREEISRQIASAQSTQEIARNLKIGHQVRYPERFNGLRYNEMITGPY